MDTQKRKKPAFDFKKGYIILLVFCLCFACVLLVLLVLYKFVHK